MGSVRDDEDFFEEDIVFDQQRLLINRTAQQKSAIYRVSSGKCITFAKTLGLCGTFFGLGLCVAVPDYTFASPIVDVKDGASSPTNLFTARSFGYIVGSLIAGFLFDRYNRLFLLFLSLLFTCIFISLTPWCHTVWLLESNMLVLGISVGFLSTGGNVLCLDLWGRNSGPFMQALHFSFALGILVAPLLSSPMAERAEIEKFSTGDNKNNNNYNSENNVLPITSPNINSSINNIIKRELYNEFNDKPLNKTETYNQYDNGKTKNKILTQNTMMTGSIYTVSPSLPGDAVYTNGKPSEIMNKDILQNFENKNPDSNIEQTEVLLSTVATTEVFEGISNSDLGTVTPSSAKSINNSKLQTVVESVSNEKCKTGTQSNRNCDTSKESIFPQDRTMKQQDALNIRYTNMNTVSEVSATTSTTDKTTSLQEVYTAFNAENNSVLTSVLLFPNDHYSLHRSKPGTYDNDTEHLNTLFGLVAHKVEKYGFSKLQFTYLIVGLVIFLLSLLFFAFLCNNPRDPKSKQDEFGAKSKKMSNLCIKIFLVPLTAWFLFLCVGLQATMSQLITLYAMKSPLGGNLSTTSSLPVIFLASFTAMRFASIFFSSGLSPAILLNINIFMFSMGTLVMTALSKRFEEALWTGCALIGIGLASMVPTTILWIERYIHVSNKITMVFVVSSTLGEMLLPNTVYQFMVSDPSMFLYAMVTINCLTALTLVMLWVLMGKQGQKCCLASHDGYHLANQHDEEDMLDMGNILQPTSQHGYVSCMPNNNGLLINGHFASVP